MCLCCMASVLETVFEGVRAESSGWDPWRMEERLFRVCLEGLLTLAIMRGIRRAVLFYAGLNQHGPVPQPGFAGIKP